MKINAHFAVHMGRARGGEPGEVVVFVTGEVDLAAIHALRAALDRAIAGGPRVVVDLSGVEFVDGAAVGVLEQAFRRADAVGGEVCLRSPSPAVRRLLALLDLEGVFPVERCALGV